MKMNAVSYAVMTAALVFVAGDLFASPRAAEALGPDFPIAADGLLGWHVGGFYRYQSRELDYRYESLSQDTIAFHVGRDIFSWLSVYGFVGTVDCSFKDSFLDSDIAVAYGGGAWINLVDHDLLSSLSTETKFRIQASAQIGAAKPEIGGYEYRYTETYGSLTFSIVNELIGNKNIWPDAIGLFFGPTYSKLDADDLETSGDNVGVIFGLDVYVTRKVSLSGSYETYGHGDYALNFSLGCRF